MKKIDLNKMKEESIKNIEDQIDVEKLKKKKKKRGSYEGVHSEDFGILVK